MAIIAKPYKPEPKPKKPEPIEIQDEHKNDENKED